MAAEAPQQVSKKQSAESIDWKPGAIEKAAVAKLPRQDQGQQHLPKIA